MALRWWPFQTWSVLTRDKPESANQKKLQKGDTIYAG